MTKTRILALLILAFLSLGCSLTARSALFGVIPTHESRETPLERPVVIFPPSPIPSPTFQENTCIVSVALLNFRACPGTNCEVLEVLEGGREVQIIAFGDWFEVLIDTGENGFVNSNYCKIGE